MPPSSTTTMMQALQSVLSLPDGVIVLNFPALNMKVSLGLWNRQVRWLKSPTLPAWPTFLHDQQVSGQVVQRLIDNPAAQPLLDAGYTPHQLYTLAQDRLLYALLPFMRWPCTWEHQPVEPGTLSPPFPQTEACLLEPALEPLLALSEALTPAQRQLSPAQRLIANPLFTAPLPAQLQAVYNAALRERTLAQMAAELSLRWDALLRAVIELLSISESGQSPLLQGVPHEKFAFLQPGEDAPNFCLPPLRGAPVRLSDYKGQKVWLIFNRQSTCGFCTPRHELLAVSAPALIQAGVQVLSVWGSSMEMMYSGVGQLGTPFPVMPDPHRIVYQRYSVRKRRGAALSVHNLRQWQLVLHGLELMGTRAFRLQGEGARLPAEFLIDEAGVIQRAHYSRYATDWLEVAEVLAWAKGQS